MRYLTKRRGSLVADAGDYVYPSDVRFTIKKIFYMLRPQVSQAASLRKHGFSNMTFGLNDQVLRQRVVNGALPAECPEHPQTK